MARRLLLNRTRNDFLKHDAEDGMVKLRRALALLTLLTLPVGVQAMLVDVTVSDASGVVFTAQFDNVGTASWDLAQLTRDELVSVTFASGATADGTAIGSGSSITNALITGLRNFRYNLDSSSLLRLAFQVFQGTSFGLDVDESLYTVRTGTAGVVGVPEPAGLALLGVGLIGLAWRGRHRRQNA